MLPSRDVLVEIDLEFYRTEDGRILRYEVGTVTPNGNTVDAWVLRDRDYRYIDHDQFRHDLWERHNLGDAISMSEYLEKTLG